MGNRLSRSPICAVLDRGRYALASCIALAMLAGCGGSRHADQEQRGSSAPAASKASLSIVSTVGSPTALPEYAAVDWDRPGHPALTPSEEASIRSALAKVKPCQRGLVRYALPAYPAELPFVIFFQPEHGQGAPVFGEPRMYYLTSEGDVVTASPTDPYAGQMEKFGIQFLIDHQPCAPVSQ
jgi:hypothetical protein